MIVSPTRELAKQIFTVAQPFVATVPWLRALLLVREGCAVPDASCAVRQAAWPLALMRIGHVRLDRLRQSLLLSTS